MAKIIRILTKIKMHIHLSKVENPEDESGIPESELTKKVNEKGEKFYNDYKIISPLGEGAYSKVKLVEKNGKKYAMKIIDKKKLAHAKKGFGFNKIENGTIKVNNLLEDAIKEIAILKKCNDKNIIKLYEILHDNIKDKLYLILEYCSNGTLMIYDEDEDKFQINKNFYKNNNPDSDYSEDEIRLIIRQIVLGIDYLHKNGVIHRDIKPDNILFDENNNIKITDFNVSTFLSDKNDDLIPKNCLGTKYFRPPEVCKNMENKNNNYDEDNENNEINNDNIVEKNCLKSFTRDINIIHGKPLDIWALGVTSYILAYKKLPFVENDDNFDEDLIDLFDIIINKDYEIPNNRMSKGFVDFLSKCLIKDPLKRITINEIKKLEWINENELNLTKIKSPPKIEVSINEIKSSIAFFLRVKMLKIKHFAQNLRKKIKEVNIIDTSH